MSCAPRLISRSLSGNRNDIVSRESSTHSMISMSSPVTKSLRPKIPPRQDSAQSIAECFYLRDRCAHKVIGCRGARREPDDDLAGGGKPSRCRDLLLRSDRTMAHFL